MQSKFTRQNRIKEILQQKEITSHEQLVKILQTENIEITQATLSRDFAELGVMRTNSDSGIRYILNSEEANKHIIKLIGFEILNIASNESTIVIRTLAGRAQGVAFYIDRLNKEEILGTVAGDDTVLIIPNKHENIPKITKLIKEIMTNVPKQ